MALLLAVPLPAATAAPGIKPAVTYATPSGLTSSAQATTSLTFKWNAVSGAPKYRIQLSPNADMSGATFYRFSSTSGEIRDLKPATKYYAKVRVITLDGANLSPYSSAVSAKTLAAPALPAISNPLSVASYNVKCDNCFDGLANELTWSGRRDAVVSTIVSKVPDVVGIQEASQGWLKNETRPGGLTQFEDLQERLFNRGINYQLANAKRNNCVNDVTPTNCVYSDRGASQGTKILYNKGTVELVSQGSVALPKVSSTDNTRYLAWSILRQRSTGKSFFFGDTQLDSSKASAYYLLRQSQTSAIASAISRINTGKLPVLMVGDFNSHKWTEPSNAPYDVMVSAGYVDPLGNTYKNDAPSAAATAEQRIRANYDSFNGFERKARARNTTGNGTYLDYIFTSKMRVAKWETVINIDAAGNFVGTIPSDHNMVSAVVQLP
ncbi:endonuclease/exonuclease/phosphatase family protein [Pseudarthrobacter sp. S9]|uniref:endonuclease/exonuclease/phosphatase family protein n=1 Tax=Pseudarthrobacter sp. S9 TaxID=3418421 RepID=UPI003D056C64